jgi:immunity protein, SdpI family
MKFKIKTEILPILLIIISILASFYFYANFPEQVPTHWNWQGQPDDWSSKAFGAFFFPALIFGLYLLFIFLPKIDPRKKRYEQFQNTYHRFKNVFILFFTIIYFTASLNAIGWNIKIEWVVPTMIGLLFIFIGNYLSKLKPNYFIGIRTPWTLANEEVWNKSHRFSGKVFALMGVFMISTLFLPKDIGAWLVIGPIFLGIAIILIYSYLVYVKIEKR